VNDLNIKEFLKPTPVKILITVLMPIPVYFFVTFSIENVLDFYWYLLTPIIKVYAGEMYNELNPFILLWIPFYLAACLIQAGYRKEIQRTSETRPTLLPS
jgi:hypothetical protein